MKTSAIKHKTFFIMGFLKVNIYRSSDASSKRRTRPSQEIVSVPAIFELERVLKRAGGKDNCQLASNTAIDVSICQHILPLPSYERALKSAREQPILDAGLFADPT
jgi:hypothetical protein